jgi:hypothetical protein
MRRRREPQRGGVFHLRTLVQCDGTDFCISCSRRDLNRHPPYRRVFWRQKSGNFRFHLRTRTSIALARCVDDGVTLATVCWGKFKRLRVEVRR